MDKLKVFIGIYCQNTSVVAEDFSCFRYVYYFYNVERGLCNNKKNTKRRLYAYVSVMGKTPKEKHGNERRRPYNYPRNAQAQTQRSGTESRNYSYPSGNVQRYSKHVHVIQLTRSKEGKEESCLACPLIAFCEV